MGIAPHLVMDGALSARESGSEASRPPMRPLSRGAKGVELASGEAKLVAAMLADAIGLAARALRAREADLRPSADESEAWVWLFEPAPVLRDARGLPWLSFETVCAAIGRDADAMRRVVRRRVERQARLGHGRVRPQVGSQFAAGGRVAGQAWGARRRELALAGGR